MEIKECNLAGNRTYAEVINGFLPALADYYKDPAPYAIAPFQIFGNLYYVGDKKVCMHLVDTGEGLILFDTGFSHHYHGLLDSVKALGFSPADIKIVIHSHGHFDHFGGGDRLRDTYGATIYMSEVDTLLTRQMPERALMKWAPCQEDTICYPDVMIRDGDMITLGNTSIQCVLSPGHTPGTMSFFFEATDGKEKKQVGYFGGVGFLTMYREYLQEYALESNMLEQLRDTIIKLSQKQVDIFLGNHPGHNCTLEKRQYMLDHPGTNPFVNSKGWQIFLQALEARRADFEARRY